MFSLSLHCQENARVTTATLTDVCLDVGGENLSKAFVFQRCSRSETSSGAICCVSTGRLY